MRKTAQTNPYFLTKPIRLLVKKLNEALQGKQIKIAHKNGMADLEFGISGSPWRMRAGERK